MSEPDLLMARLAGDLAEARGRWSVWRHRDGHPARLWSTHRWRWQARREAGKHLVARIIRGEAWEIRRP